jgi:hypothetical protein
LKPKPRNRKPAERKVVTAASVSEEDEHVKMPDPFSEEIEVDEDAVEDDSIVAMEDMYTALLSGELKQEFIALLTHSEEGQAFMEEVMGVIEPELPQWYHDVKEVLDNASEDARVSVMIESDPVRIQIQ